MKFFMSDHVEVKPGKDGISVITIALPSHLVADVVEIIDMLLYAARWLRTRTRSAEAIAKARQFYKMD